MMVTHKTSGAIVHSALSWSRRSVTRPAGNVESGGGVKVEQIITPECCHPEKRVNACGRPADREVSVVSVDDGGPFGYAVRKTREQGNSSHSGRRFCWSAGGANPNLRASSVGLFIVNSDLH